MDIPIFVGKNTPLKRYKSYFPMFNLVQPNDFCGVVLCHSLGIVDAVKSDSCIERIVCMDGVNLVDRGLDETKYDIVMFRPIQRKGESDEKMFSKIIYYQLPETIRHYPYQDKNIRDKIVNEIKN